MLYIEILRERYPLGWEELEWKFRKLKQLNWFYQLSIGQPAFQLDVPPYQFTLIRWGIRPDVNTSAPREVLYEGHDYKAVLGYISLLLKVEEDQREG